MLHMSLNNIGTVKGFRYCIIFIASIAILIATSSLVTATEINKCTTISEPGSYKLNKNIEESDLSVCILIGSSDVILDGSGNLIDGIGVNYGVYVHNDTTFLTNVTVKNFELTDWENGIYYNNSHDGHIIDNNVSFNINGVKLNYSNRNKLTDNIANSNYVSGLSLENSVHNTLEGNIANSNFAGTSFLYSSNYNTFNNNRIRLNLFGIALGSSDNNNITNNIVLMNDWGIFFYSSRDNLIFDNHFNNTNSNYRFNGQILPNQWNTALEPGQNIVGGSYLGGNFWADPDGEGFSQKCNDENTDGICDLPYPVDLWNVDELPLTNIDGPPDPIPEVTTIILVLFGLAGLIGFKKYNY